MAKSPQNNIAQLLRHNEYDLQQIRKKSMGWFEAEAAKLWDVNTLTPDQALNGDARKLKTSFQPGSMYFFMYDAKHKDTLPYYDMFPLVFPFSTFKDGFIGLNLHYLPYDLRIKFLWKLQDFNLDNSLTPRARLGLHWELLSTMAKYKPAQACVKKYLGSHVRSPFRIVPPDDWATACMLPLERFSGSDKFTVWADSLRKI